jgi:serine acetyltransferase
MAPARFILAPWLGRCDIHYRADIGPGLHILHGSLGVVISGNAVIGKNLLLVGGNCVGIRRQGEIRIGDDVLLGANACIIGPVVIGDGVKLSPNALVTDDVSAGEVMLAPLATPRRRSP